MFEDKVLENNLALRYQSYTSGIGKQIINNEVGLKELENYIKNKPEIDKNKSGQQELLEAIINQYLVG
jgi:xylose isomerase